MSFGFDFALCSFIKVELFGVNGKNYGLIINNLYAAIFPKDCSVKVRTYVSSASLVLTKVLPTLSIHQLLGSELNPDTAPVER